MRNMPQGLTDSALKTWKELGPLKFADIVENSNEKINLSLTKIGASS